MKKTHTKGNVIVEDIKIGDIHYEYGYGSELVVTVKTLPVKEERDDDNYYTWISETESGKEIEYGVSDKYSYYGPNIYTYPAYRPMDKWSEGDFKKMQKANKTEISPEFAKMYNMGCDPYKEEE